MCNGTATIVDGAPITEHKALPCGHEAYILSNALQCNVHPEATDKPGLNVYEYTPCPEHGEKQIIQYVMVAVDNYEEVQIGDLKVVDCQVFEQECGCPACILGEQLQHSFEATPQACVERWGLTCPACETD